MKQIITFFSVITLLIAFLLYYFGVPFGTPDPTPEQVLQPTTPTPDINEQQAQTTQQIPLTASPDPQATSTTHYLEPSVKNKFTVRYFTRPSHVNMKYLQVIANDETIEAILDTGASYTVFNTKTIKRLGIQVGSTPKLSATPAGYTYSYPFTLSSLKLGNIELRNVECIYIPGAQDNLLGGSFLNNFIYSVDEDSQLITLIPKGQNVYFTDRGIEPVPGSGWIEIDGKRYSYKDGRLERVE